MRTFRILALGAALLCIVSADAQTKPAQTPPRVVKGTTQMAGDNGKVNVTYTIGQTQPVNITLLDARLSVERFPIGIYSHAPAKDEKLLILTYTIQNPNNEETRYNSSTLKFTVVDQEDENHEFINEVRRKDGDERLDIGLKPAQKIEVQTAIVVPAKGTVPKLIVEHRNGGPVLRYDLRPFLKGLDAPYAGDSAFDARAEIEAKPDAYYPMMGFDVKFIGQETKERQFGVWTIDPDRKIFFIPKFQFKKATKGGDAFRFKAEVESEDGDRYPGQGPYKGSLDEHSTAPTEFGQEIASRMVFDVPKGVHLKKLRISEDNGGGSRVYIFPLDVVGGTAAGAASASGASAATPQPAATGLQGDDYTTILRKPDGSIASQFNYTVASIGGAKKTLIDVAGKKGVLSEDSSGTVTFYNAATGETLRAPKAQGKEPQASVQYFTLVYANSAAPKPKKNGLLGNIAGNILGGAVKGLAGQMVTGAVLSGLGQASAPTLLGAAVENAKGYAVQSFAVELGRAVMTSAKPTDAAGPEVVTSQVKVKDKVYVDTEFKSRRGVSEADFAISGTPTDVNATDLFKKLAGFLSSGISDDK